MSKSVIFLDPEKFAELLVNVIPKDPEGKIKVIIGKPEEITFKEAIVITHNETKDIWVVPSGKRLHLYGFIISTDSAGKLEIYIGNVLFHPFTFNEKKSVPFAMPFDFWLPEGISLRGKWVSDTGSGNAYITPVGYESEV